MKTRVHGGFVKVAKVESALGLREVMAAIVKASARRKETGSTVVLEGAKGSR